ncbi:MAG TPA: arylsulfatase [Candidatus Binatia bacterium]|nr:arylsulfatase [Candidatus Binatia bacterium]
MKRGVAVGLTGLAVAGGATVALSQGLDFKTIMSSLVETQSIADSDVIPAPAPTFGGTIERDVAKSTAWWPPAIAPKPGSPNVLLVLIDDEGFAANSSFGGLIPTPVSDQLAREGLRYTNFHTTSLCSPTRAALITGRNHGAVGYEMIAELSTGFPGYNAQIGKENATVARILQANGYATAWFGKDHNVPLYWATDAGPKDQWPTGQGFDYFYGFLGGDMDQWHPTIFENTNQIFPDVGHPGYNLNVAMADQAVSWVHRMTDLRPTQPLFLYYAPGATHAPHQPTPAWIAKMKGKFDMGWDAYRQYAFKRQQQQGIIPKGAKLTPWPDENAGGIYGETRLPHWNTLSASEKREYAHMMEVYAAYLAETDYEVGRVIQSFKDTGRYNNTLIFYIHGDNGASAEGGFEGTPSEVWAFNGVFPKVKRFWPRFGSHWGDEYTDVHYPVAWAWALDTPFKWTKQVASYFGGTRNGLIVSWPGHIGDPGGLRTQFHHVIDIEPTILEACGIKQPSEVDGVKQKPIEGVSMVYTFDKANANAPSNHHVQYFEMFGAPAIYQDGWIATTDPTNLPWLVLSNKFTPDRWETMTWHLYHVTADDDWTEYADVQSQYPDKLKELQALFVSEGEKNNVFPINNLPNFFDPRPSLIGDRTTVTYHPGITALNQADTPNILNRDFTIAGSVSIPSNGANGVIVADGGRFGGYSLWLRDGKPNFTYNLIDILPKPYRWSGTDAIGPGRHTIAFKFEYDGGGFGKGGSGTLLVDGKAVASQRIDHTVPFTLPWFEGLDIGSDNSTEVDPSYTVPNAFTGTIESVTFNTGPMKISRSQVPMYMAGLYAAWAGIQ